MREIQGSKKGLNAEKRISAYDCRVVYCSLLAGDYDRYGVVGCVFVNGEDYVDLGKGHLIRKSFLMLKSEGNVVKTMERINMAEQKAVPVSIVVSDKGQRYVTIGKAFINLNAEGNRPVLQVVFVKELLDKAIKDGVVTEQVSTPNDKYPDPVMDNKKTIRMAGFAFRKKV